MKHDKIVIAGAGLVGSLLALMLKREGFDVEVYEKRQDPRKVVKAGGRSINLALSHRGIAPLKIAGVFDKVLPFLIPMKGRMMHDDKGSLTSQPYGMEGQSINSVSRRLLNEVLIEESEKSGVNFYFEAKCKSIAFEENTLFFENGSSVSGDLIVGADGAFSVVRQKLQSSDRFSFSQLFIDHGYKELTIEPIHGDFALDPNHLHIWPRGNFMLIALPNADKTFTCTLFFPFEGSPSFSSLTDDEKILSFFKKYFRDTIDLIPDLLAQFHTNPTSSLVTISCEPWNKNKTLLIGDAAHAIVPFYGQGMNSGFEDVRLLMECAKKLNYDWKEVTSTFAKSRKKDADAISELALHNFTEMRDHVGSSRFLKRKKLEAVLQEKFPDQWLPLYSMVTFSDIPYAHALQLGKIQTEVINEFMTEENEEPDHQKIIDRFNNLAPNELKAYL
ncbi:MAG: NAD(P)/FAD-dependent oxidoreductase [Bacteroidota bacterium]